MKIRRHGRKKTVGEMTLGELVARIVFLIVQFHIAILLITIVIAFFHAIVDVLFSYLHN